ncbi:hypothetical protein AAFC00_002427 [Neodothiora populina]|uniref:AAA+ ATPase domain-containing protein n=1 Tax=Neodothiora populina TaxID=2781224 RepID=A0ABR3P7C5_9PEZI
MTGATSARLSSAPAHQNEAATAYFEHSSAPRVNTDIVVTEALRREYPQLHLTVTPRGTCDILAFAAAGHAAAAPIDQEQDRLTWLSYRPPVRRLNGENDGLAEYVHFGKFMVEWENKEFVLYIAEGRDGMSAYPSVTNQYILSSSSKATERLLLEAGRWSMALHDEVWVFDQGMWQKSHELWESVQAAEWENVILNEDMKKSLIRDVDNFFNSRETYKKLKVPWKRGVIYYGPPGNGKTISIKAMMHALYKRKDPIPTLYVKTLSSFAGPEYALRQIFGQARRFAPCYLIFEDLDSLITPNVRSYFLNEVDGLKNNDGILMVGSTNHLDQLDPGIAKRPSRFDRKYYFPDPNKDERYAYAKFWQTKLSDNEDIEFPDEICEGMSKITDGFSFAYMQEAFIAALLALAVHDTESMSSGDKRHSNEDVSMPSHKELPSALIFTRADGTSEEQWNAGTRAIQSQSVGYEVISQADSNQPIATAYEPTLQGLKTFCELVRDMKIIDQTPKSIRGNVYLEGGGESRLERFPLWVELKKQVQILKEEMDRNDTAGHA